VLRKVLDLLEDGLRSSEMRIARREVPRREGMGASGSAGHCQIPPIPLTSVQHCGSPARAAVPVAGADLVRCIRLFDDASMLPHSTRPRSRHSRAFQPRPPHAHLIFSAPWMQFVIVGLPEPPQVSHGGHAAGCEGTRRASSGKECAASTRARARRLRSVLGLPSKPEHRAPLRESRPQE
jgi:hypothetical protein